MYLSKLEMVGFKSFGLKTDLTFDDGVTAIVGPNGCGKTNIVDAIRWVLGEQKTSMLRADSMEHVIFNGSKTRKPLGMAEVSLTIENNKHILPTEYSQVVITRRLFRSGESQYLLNRTVCRLKDIVELFMDTGMGANAYSVIELKMIETILSDKADDRRHLFEEAAGVTKYKARRKEAQRKLEAAQRDISRVSDIVREVQKTVNSLSRQAEKARQHQEISQQLREREQRAFRIERAEAVRQRDIASSHLATLVQQRHTAEEQLLRLERELEQAERLHNEAEVQLRNAMENEAAVRTAQSNAEAQIALLTERVSAIDRTLVRLGREEEDSQGEQTTAQEQLMVVIGKLEAARSDSEAASAELQRRKELSAQAEAAVVQAKSMLAAARVRAQQVQDRLTEIQRESDRINVHIDSTQRRLGILHDSLQQASQRITEIESQIQEQQSALPAVEQELQNAEANLREAEQRKQALRTMQEEKQSALDQLRSAEAHARASLDFLIGLVDTTESSRFLLNSSEWKPSSEKLTLAEVINTSDALRVAIEASLGEAARYFVVADKTEAEEAIAALSRNNIGKATFLCRDTIPQLPSPPAVDLIEGVIGWASEQVEADEQLRGAIRGLLGKTLIADTLATAWLALQKTEAERIVTLSGEVVHRAGAVRGGSTTRTEGIRVGKRERIEQLKTELSDVEQRIEAIIAEIHNVKNEYASIDLSALAEQVRRNTVARNTLAQRIESLLLRKSELESQSTELSKEYQEAGQELQRLHNQAQMLVQNEQAIADQREGSIAEVSQFEDVLHTAELQYQETVQKVRETEILVVRLDADVQSLLADQARLGNQQLTMEQRKEQRRQEQEQLSQQKEQLNNELQNVSVQRDHYTKALEDAKVNREQADNSVQSCATSMQEAAERIRAQRRLLDATVQECHEAEMQRNSIELRLSALVQHAVDELGIDPNDLQTIDDVVDQTTDVDGNELEHIHASIQEARRKLTMMGNVNFLALEEHERENERLQFMTTQLNDLLASEQTLTQTILEINQTARELFTSTFEKIRENFVQLFKLLFSDDDEADLQMIETDDHDPLECKVEIIAKPRGKRPHSIEMLSGGEKTLTAIALLFAIYLVKPSPFCILDEVDAPLDDANIDRYLKIIRKFSENTQFLMITHNKRTMEAADTLYGVTMEEPAVSKVVSVQLGTQTAKEAA